jgi:hypothetical protein
VSDITFTNNLIRHAARGFTVLGIDTTVPASPSQLTKRILIQNNLLLDIGYPEPTGGGNGDTGMGLLYASNGGAVDDLTVEHNTIFNLGSILVPGDTGAIKGLRFIWRNNIHAHNTYGVLGSGFGVGVSTLNAYFTSYVYTHNVMITNPYPELYPANQFEAANLAAVGFTDVDDLRGTGTDYSLTAQSPYHNAGTDGFDPGVKWIVLSAAIDGVEAGTEEGEQPVPPTPAPPGLQVAGPITASSVILIWGNSTDADLAGYHIYRSTVQGQLGSLVATRTPASAAAAHTPITRYIEQRSIPCTCYYTIKSFDIQSLESEASNVQSVTLTGR